MFSVGDTVRFTKNSIKFTATVEKVDGDYLNVVTIGLMPQRVRILASECEKAF